jgi:hypothetical protein
MKEIFRKKNLNTYNYFNSVFEIIKEKKDKGKMIPNL